MSIADELADMLNIGGLLSDERDTIRRAVEALRAYDEVIADWQHIASANEAKVERLTKITERAWVWARQCRVEATSYRKIHWCDDLLAILDGREP